MAAKDSLCLVPQTGRVFPPKRLLSHWQPGNDMKAKKAQDGSSIYRKSELWIASSSSLKPKTYQSDWKLHRDGLGESNKYLELADIALGLAPAKHKTKRRA